MIIQCRISDSTQQWTIDTAQWLVDRIREFLAVQQRVRMVLPGGSTPRELLKMLASDTGNSVEWSRLDLFMSDERLVPTTDGQSNQRMIREALGDRLQTPGSQFFAIVPALDQPRQGAEAYHELIDSLAPNPRGHRFDIVLLGLGDDCHTASLFPGDHCSLISERWCEAAWVEKFQAFRMTLTPRALLSSDLAAFLVVGDSKREAIATILGRGLLPEQAPATIMLQHPNLVWLVDRAAAGTRTFSDTNESLAD